MMNLMHWRLVVAVADHGNITRAAERVGMTQSGASRALALMEETLGVQLFSRESRQTLPTAIGLPVIEQARLMLGALETIRQTVDSVRPMLRGTIRLASFPMVLASFLPPLLRQFNRLYPGIEVVALEVSDDEVETLLAAGLVDVGVVLNPAPERNAGPLGRDAWVAVVPAGHPLALRGTEQGVSLPEPTALPCAGHRRMLDQRPQPRRRGRVAVAGCAGRSARMEQRLHSGAGKPRRDPGAGNDLAGRASGLARDCLAATYRTSVFAGAACRADAVSGGAGVAGSGGGDGSRDGSLNRFLCKKCQILAD